MSLFLILNLKSLLPPLFALIGSIPITIGWAAQISLWFSYDSKVTGGLIKAYCGIGVLVALVIHISLLSIEFRNSRRDKSKNSDRMLVNQEEDVEKSDTYRT